METQVLPVTIYSEMTPNPNTMKFVANRMLVDEGIVAEYNDKSEAESSSVVAKALFGFPFVKGVFITRNFITVTKTATVEWEDISYELRIFLSDILKNTIEVVANVPENTNLDETVEKVETTVYTPTVTSETDQKIVDLLEEYVKPAVENDGGAIHFKSFENGIVTVILKGSCSGCPSSTETLKGGVEQLLKSYLKEVKEVVAEAQ
jgi:Fe-S cluster biogenesis protein NfuA